MTLQLLGMALVLGAIAAMSQGWYRTGFWCNLLAAVTWALVAVESDFYGLLALQTGIAILAVRGLWRLG